MLMVMLFLNRTTSYANKSVNMHQKILIEQLA